MIESFGDQKINQIHYYYLYCSYDNNLLIHSFIVAAFLGGITLSSLPPAKTPSQQLEDAELLSAEGGIPMEKKNEQMGILQGMKNCYYLLTTPKFMLLTFTMFANGKKRKNKWINWLSDNNGKET